VKYAFLVLVALFVSTASQEVSVPFDSAGKIQVVDENLINSSVYFPTYQASSRRKFSKFPTHFIRLRSRGMRAAN